MNSQEFNQMREELWRRPLTPAEEASLRQYLAAHPELHAELAEELALNQLLQQLPEGVQVSSNFTAQVLAQVKRENAVRKRKSLFAWLGRPGVAGWLPRAALGTLLICAISIGYSRHEANVRVALARNVMQLSAAVSADPQLVEDFEPIRQLGSAEPKADLELLALMK
jgi:anti-sigma factor RsiW